MMGDKNILKELDYSKYSITIEIDLLDKNVKDLKSQIEKEKNEMDNIEAQINTLKAKYEVKRLDLYQMNGKLEEKMKILSEARNASIKVNFLTCIR